MTEGFKLNEKDVQTLRVMLNQKEILEAKGGKLLLIEKEKYIEGLIGMTKIQIIYSVNGGTNKVTYFCDGKQTDEDKVV